MRKLLVSFILLTLCVFANAQREQVRIVRTDGTTIIGALQSADGSAVTIKIAGVEMTIPMSEVQLLEPYFTNVNVPDNNGDDKGDTNNVEDVKLVYGEYTITDNSTEYPDSFTMEVAGQRFTMILVRGGSFNMGYDDWHSRRMDSEPVHRVDLSSYYVSNDFVNAQTACQLLSQQYYKKEYGKKYICKWDEAKNIVERIATAQNAPYRMITESEWEYVTLQPMQFLVFPITRGYRQYWDNAGFKCMCKNEWCYDVFDVYPYSEQYDPVGPKANERSRHVARKYKAPSDSDNWNRVSVDRHDKCFVRLAISADKIPTLNK